MGFLGHPSRPNGMDSDVPWPGYVNFSGEKKDDDYKALPQRRHSGMELWACGNGSSSEDQSCLVLSKLPIDSYIFHGENMVKTC